MAEGTFDLAAMISRLDEGEMLTLGAAAKAPGSLLVVDKGGESEKLCEVLVTHAMAETVDISEKFPKGRVSGWRLNTEGGRAVMQFFDKG